MEKKSPGSGKGSETNPSTRKRIIAVAYAAVAIVLLVAVQAYWTRGAQREAIPYSQFERLLAGGQIAEVSVGPGSIAGTLKAPLANGRRSFVTTRVDPQLADKLAKQGVAYGGEASNGLVGYLLTWIVPLGIFYAIWAFGVRRMAEQQEKRLGGAMSIGKSRAKTFVETDTKTTFKDVAGVDEAKAELEEIVAFLRDAKSYGRLGARVPKGVLLVGPPGTGKTLLARAVAGEAQVPFFSISGSEFVEMFVGVGAARVRDLFEQARKAAPCIVFIDEMDALGRSRAQGSFGGGFDEKDQTLNQLLTELDGFDPSVAVMLLASTNRPEVLDPALLRAGRFDRQVLVDRPDRKGRAEILRVHAAKIVTAANLDLHAVAGITTGFTGADLANLVNEAALVATRRNADAVTREDFTMALERIVAGLEKKSRLLNDAERRRVAYHEMGHALVAASLPGVDPVLKVSIVPRGVGALGYTIQSPTEDRFLLAAGDLEDRIAVLMGGRASETLIYDGEISTGASDDLQKATEIALEMVTRYGMSAELGQRTYAPAQQSFLGPRPIERSGIAEATAREIDVAVRAIVDRACARALQILRTRRPDLEEGTRLLLATETLTAEEFPALASRLEPLPLSA